MYKPEAPIRPEELEIQFREEEAVAIPSVIGINSLGRIEENDSIYVASMNISGGNPPTLTLTWRVLQDDGNIIYGEETHLCNIFSSYAEKLTVVQPNVKGSIISLSLQVTNVTVRLAEVFCQVGLFQGTLTTAAKRKNILMSGYVATQLPLTYPGQNQMPDSQKRFVYLGSFSGALPYYINPYTTQWFEPYLIYAAYTTDATVGDRRFFFELQDVANTPLALFLSDVVQPASTTYYYIYSRRTGNAAVLTATGANNYVVIEMPPFIVPTGGRIKLDCLNRQATDASSFARASGLVWVNY